MTRDDIIRMAREADLFEHVPLTGHVSFIYDLMEFAALVAAAEREACAIRHNERITTWRLPLTEEKILSLFRTAGSPVLFARAVEREHRIGVNK